MAMATDAENVSILFAAIIREREALQRGQLPGKTNWFKKIDGPPGKGILFTGDDGWKALGALTDSAMHIGKITRRADRQAMMGTLAKVLIRKFVEERLDVNERNVARALVETSQSTKRSFKTQTHFIPCHLSSAAETTGLSLGTVRFMSRNEAKLALRGALKVQRAARSEAAKRNRPLTLRAIDHYKGFRWFVQVTVTDCAEKRSEAIALATATSALDFLQLLIGARNSRRMSIMGQSSSYQQRASIIRNEANGDLSVSAGWSTLGEITLPEGWTKQLLNVEGQMGLDQAGIVLESRLNPDLERPLSLRFLDAVQWFGEAVRDPSPSTRIIKYVTALERLTLTKRAGNIGENVSERVAALATGMIGDRSFEENKAAFKKIYGLRSDLAHGSISPNDSRVLARLGEACEFSESALGRALYNWSARMLADPAFKVGRLDNWFNDVVERVKTGHEGVILDD